MFTTFAVVSLLAVMSTLLLKDQFRSTATIAIERPEIPADLVRTTVAVYDTDLRIFRIRDKVLSGPKVEELITEFGLYKEYVAENSVAAAAGEFREDVEIITIQAREDLAIKNQGETIAFDLSYYGESPEKAALVATRLAEAFLDENRRSRNQSVEDTLAFFQRDAERLALKISQTEAQLAEFKERNAGALPESTNINAQMLDRAERELDDVEREIRDLRETRQILETDLAKESPNAPIFTTSGETVLAGADRLKVLQQQYIELSSKYSPEHPDVVRTRREIELLSGGSNQDSELDSVNSELEFARLELESLQQRYTADHPDVIKVNNRIDALLVRLSTLQSLPRTTPNSAPDNPAYISIKVQIAAATTEIQALQSRVRSLRDRIGRYESLLLQSPQVEREYLALQRDYDQAVREFNEVREMQTDAQQAQQLEVSEKGERYVLQRTPFEPKSAAFPNRLAIMILGIIFASGCALGAAVISEGLDSTVRGTRDLTMITGMPPIAVIPMIESRAETQRRTMIWSMSGLGIAALLIYMITMQIL
jgi:uncharacterized protein involved in exopolysaccharide biosynthesis